MTTLGLFRSQEKNFGHLLFLFPAAVLCSWGQEVTDKLKKFSCLKVKAKLYLGAGGQSVHPFNLQPFSSSHLTQELNYKQSFLWPNLEWILL